MLEGKRLQRSIVCRLTEWRRRHSRAGTCPGAAHGILSVTHPEELRCPAARTPPKSCTLPPPPQQALLATSAKQREARRYEDAEAGRYRPAAPAAALQGGDATAVAAEVDKARGRQERIAAAVRGLSGEPGVAPQLERVLAHAAVLCE